MEGKTNQVNGANQPIAETLSVCEQGVEENSSYLSFTVAFNGYRNAPVTFKTFSSLKIQMRDLRLDPNYVFFLLKPFGFFCGFFYESKFKHENKSK